MQRAIALACFAVLAAISCERRADVDAHYRTRGLVKSVEGTGQDLRVQIHHERIAEFKDRDGNASPMDSMAMNFALGPAVDAGSFKPGGKVEVEFDVRWSNPAPLTITRAAPLAEGTALQLGGH
jgi:Cu/Ag efflux protein CusF